MWRESGKDSINPWIFPDETLENLYQEFAHRNLLTRFSPIAFFVLSYVWITEIAVIGFRVYGSHIWSTNEFFWLTVKLFQIISASYIHYFQSGWSANARTLGCTFILWSCRLFYVVCLCHELGVPQHPAQHLYAQLWHAVHGATMSPSFTEYAVIEAVFATTRPLSFFIFGESCILGMKNACPEGQLLWTITCQRVAVGVIAGGMVYQIHADRRRNWLLSSGWESF